MSNELKDLKCPACNSDLRPGNLFVACAKWKRDDPTACWFRVWRTMNNRQLEDKDLADLIQKGRTDVLDGFKSTAGRAFTAAVVLNKEAHKVEYSFPFTTTSLDLKCPACGGAIIQEGRVFRCEKHDSKNREHTCWFSMWSEIQGHTFTAQDVADLVKEGKTRVYELTSQRGGAKKYQGRLVANAGSRQIKIQAESTPKPLPSATPATPEPATMHAGIGLEQEEDTP